MMNKYGHFKYLDFAVGAKENVSYSINKDLQEGSALTQLSVGVKPYDFASVEHNAYITSEPKPLYKMQQDLGLITADVSDENGAFNEPIVLTANFSSFFHELYIFYWKSKTSIHFIKNSFSSSLFLVS